MDTMYHPTPENLEAFVEGTLDEGDRATIESHLLGCIRCEGVVDEWRSLFNALASLPRLAPAAGFADRVMARVRIVQPWHARAYALIARFLPGTTLGWVLAVALLGVPVVTGGSLTVWLLSRSYVTAHGLWVFSTHQFLEVAGRFIGSVTTSIMQTDAAAWLAHTLDTLLGSAGTRGIGMIAALGALGIVLSVWVLYRNLFRTPNRESTYVTFSF